MQPTISNPKAFVRPPRRFTSDNPHIPAPEYPFRHCTPVQIRFSDLDVFGHVNNNVYMAWLDTAKIAYYDLILGGALDLHGIGAVVVNINCSFLSPTMLNEPVEVWTATSAISKHSFTLDQRIINSETGQTKCIAKTVLCCIDSNLKTVDVPEYWVESTENHEQRKIKN